jgi:hypothetical protein
MPKSFSKGIRLEGVGEHSLHLSLELWYRPVLGTLAISFMDALVLTSRPAW